MSPVRFWGSPYQGGREDQKRNFLPPNKPRTSVSAHTLEVGPDLDVEDEADNWQRAASCIKGEGYDHSARWRTSVYRLRIYSTMT